VAGSTAVGDKYWPPVSRIDQAYGDRNLMCACPPISAYLDDTDAEAVTTRAG
jgi:glycine dehydrogenase